MTANNNNSRLERQQSSRPNAANPDDDSEQEDENQLGTPLDTKTDYMCENGGYALILWTILY